MNNESKPEQELRTANSPEWKFAEDLTNRIIIALQNTWVFPTEPTEETWKLLSHDWENFIYDKLKEYAASQFKQIAVEPEKSAEDFWAEYSQPNHSGARIVTEANFKQAIREAQRIAVSSEPKIEEWIDVKERLPEKGQWARGSG